MQKPTPPAVESLLRQFDSHREASNPNVHPCEGAEFHSPRPLKVHGYRITGGHNFWLCGTCKDNIDTYIYLWEQNNGLDWAIQRCFGNHVRRISDMIINSRREL